MSRAIEGAEGVDLNTASSDELENIGGMGPARARRVMVARPIHSWEDLRRIEGFSDQLVDDLRQAGARIGRSSEVPKRQGRQQCSPEKEKAA